MNACASKLSSNFSTAAKLTTKTTKNKREHRVRADVSSLKLRWQAKDEHRGHHRRPKSAAYPAPASPSLDPSHTIRLADYTVEAGLIANNGDETSFTDKNGATGGTLGDARSSAARRGRSFWMSASEMSVNSGPQSKGMTTPLPAETGEWGWLTITIQHPSSAVALWWWWRLRNREASECKSRGRSPAEGRLRGFTPFMTWSSQTRDSAKTHKLTLVTSSVPFAC